MLTYQDYLKLRTQATEEVNKLKPLGLTAWHQEYDRILDASVKHAVDTQPESLTDLSESASDSDQEDKTPTKFICTTQLVKGVWIRSPFFKRWVDAWDDGEGSPMSATSALRGKGLWGIVHRVLNSKSKLLSRQEFVKEDNAAGYSLRSLRNPLYFVREERYLCAESKDLLIVSKGFNYCGERVAGHCSREYTTVSLITGGFVLKVLWEGRSDRHKSYYLTYRHVVDTLVTRFSETKCLDLELV